ncbi:AAA family ATPase [Sedimenticola hydrogenitrophicus]|uniref:AAA family ATPase n=1 Tax=Sedimenticola hydrogenitrophicus TaxID=2967975 RepID=UPI002FF53A95
MNMLIDFSVTNFLSIRDRATLSLVSGKGSELSESHIISATAPSVPDLLRGAVIYGANSAGKSNLIKALHVMKLLVEESAKEGQSGESLKIHPFLFDDHSADQPTEFEINFVVEGVRYQYGFAATSRMVLEEWLYAYPKGRPQRWIERAYDPNSKKYAWGSMDKLTGQKQVWQEATRSNALFLSTAVQLNSKQLKPVYDWFDNDLRIAGIGGWEPSFTMGLCEENNDRERVMDFLRVADLNISDIELNKKEFDPDDLPGDIPASIREDLLRRLDGRSVRTLQTVHTTANGRRVLLDFDNESDGTQKIFALAGPWIYSLRNGYTLIIDELHDNLHPLMVRYLVGLFNSAETNPNNAQLIFTTHDTSLLDQDVFRRDQVWFCDKDDSQSSQLYPLTHFKPRKKVENLERGYLAGRYGALPYIQRVQGF